MREKNAVAPGLFYDAGRTLDQIPADAVVAITKVRDEAWRLPFWLAYHRWIGIDHFVVVNNRSRDATRDLLVYEPDVTLLDAPGPFRGPTKLTGYNSWIAAIQGAAPQDRWNLVLDSDELFVVAPWRKGGLRRAISRMEEDGFDVMWAVMVDCYPETLPFPGSVAPIVPWVRAPWFDRGPYVRWDDRGDRQPDAIYHGVRERLCWPNWRWQRRLPRAIRARLGTNPPPMIRKAPLFRRAQSRGVSTHTTTHAASRRAGSLSYLLHYKLDIDVVDKIESAVTEGQYHNDSSEYRALERHLFGRSHRLLCNRSCQFTGYESLLEARICATGPHASDAHSNLETALREILEYRSGSFAETVPVRPWRSDKR